MIRLALAFLRYDRARTAGALLGSVAAVFLVGQQLGIATFLTGAMIAPLRLVPADLWVVDARSTNVNALGALDRRVLSAVAAQPGVRHAETLVAAPATARFEDGTVATVTLVGVADPLRGGLPPLEAGRPEDLLRDGALQFDRFDRRAFGQARVGDRLEVNGRAAWLAAQSASVRAFSTPIMVTTLERAQALAGLAPTVVQAVLVDVGPGADAITVAHAIERAVPGVRAWPPAALGQRTQRTLLATTGIAASIGTLVVFAVLVGCVIIGLTLYAAVLERLRDYGTLKAIGADDATVTRLVLAQAGLVALGGAGIGLALVQGFRLGVRNSGVLFDFPAAAWLGLAAGTLLIAGAGAVLAVRRVRALEPAAVFRG